MGKAIRIDRHFALPDTRTLATEWILQNAPQDARILMDKMSFHLRRNAESHRALVMEKKSVPREKEGYRKVSDWFFDIQEKAANIGKTYFITEIYHPIAHREKKGGYSAIWMSPEKMALQLQNFHEKYDFIILSPNQLDYYFLEGVPPEYSFMRDFYTALNKRTSRVKEFAPAKGKRKGPSILIYKTVSDQN